MDATTLRPTARIYEGPSYEGADTTSVHVDVTWTGAELDRPCTGGFGLAANKRGRSIAARLKRAIEDGVFYSNPRIVRDRGGKTYVEAKALTIGKYLNTDLARIGY